MKALPHMKRKLQLGLILAVIIGLYLAIAAFVLREQTEKHLAELRARYNELIGPKEPKWY